MRFLPREEKFFVLFLDQVRLISESGEVWRVGSCWVRNGYQSWGKAVDVPMSTVDRVEMRSATDVTFTAHFA